MVHRARRHHWDRVNFACFLGSVAFCASVAAAQSSAAPLPAKRAPAPSPSEIVAAAPATDWTEIAASDLLVMDLAGGRRVIIQLMPPPFSQGWIGNIRKLAAAHWWDGTSINRVQDNYVVQWGDATENKALPVELVNNRGVSYTVSNREVLDELLKSVEKKYQANDENYTGYGDLSKYPPTVMHIRTGITIKGNRYKPTDWETHDSYAKVTAFWLGWPIANSPTRSWPIHCYGMVGVGRDMPPDTGTGAELYTVIGQAPRHLDRNIALVGRVISGIENLSSLPRGTGDLGFYKTPAERTAITSIRLGNEVTDLPRYEYLSTESASFARYADARANRRDAFFIQPAGGADICNIPVPVRVAK